MSAALEQEAAARKYILQLVRTGDTTFEFKNPIVAFCTASALAKKFLGTLEK